MSTITAQILIGNGHLNHDGILSGYSTLNFSENSRPAWILKNKYKNIVWIPTIERTLEDGLLLIALNFLENKELNEMAKHYFTDGIIKENIQTYKLKHKKTNERVDTLYSQISTNHLDALHKKCQQINWGALKVILNIFKQSHLLTQLNTVQNYSMNIEVCAPIYCHLYSNWSNSFLVEGFTPENSLQTSDVKYSVFEELPEEITQKLEIIDANRTIAKNEVHWYKFGSNTISLLEDKAQYYDNNNDIEQLMIACGYSPKHNNKQKFLKHQQQWTNLTRNIPKSYLTALNIDIADIEKAIDLDHQLYQKALNDVVLDYCELENIIGHFRDIVSEKEAIDVLKIYAKKRNVDCQIKIKDLKTIIIKPDGGISTIEYKPIIKITKAHIGFMINPLSGQTIRAI
jgi:hypothetical protein